VSGGEETLDALELALLTDVDEDVAGERFPKPERSGLSGWITASPSETTTASFAAVASRRRDSI
jgi:hypothetical protein